MVSRARSRILFAKGAAQRPPVSWWAVPPLVGSSRETNRVIRGRSEGAKQTKEVMDRSPYVPSFSLLHLVPVLPPMD